MEKEYIFKVKDLGRTGGGRYQDTVHKFEVKSNQPEWVVKQFCENLLNRGMLITSDQFKKISDDTYYYEFTEAFLD